MLSFDQLFIFQNDEAICPPGINNLGVSSTGISCQNTVT